MRKDCARLEAYGTVDELNSNLGLLLSVLTDETARNSIIAVQNVLFCMGAVLATEEDSATKMMQSVLPEDVESLERQMDEWNKEMPGWRGFVLPGGTEAAARAHMCRTICRRAERRIFALAEQVTLPADLLKYMNRLSDLLFVLALHENFLAGKDEIVWQKRG